MLLQPIQETTNAAESRAKAAMDLICSAILLLLLAPLLATISICILLTMGRPVLFRQLRTGLNGDQFYILKFRTMHGQPGETGAAISDDKRLTALGRLLRLSSLDELPQIFNVLKGEMSLVGPRPQLVSFEKYYTPFQFRRHEVKPGITGWAQINGRNSISWDRKFELDVWYVDNWSMLLDLRILALTPLRLLFYKEVVGPYRCSKFSFEAQRDFDDLPGAPNTQPLRAEKRKVER